MIVFLRFAPSASNITKKNVLFQYDVSALVSKLGISYFIWRETSIGGDGRVRQIFEKLLMTLDTYQLRELFTAEKFVLKM